MNIIEKLMWPPCKSIMFPFGAVTVNFKRVNDILDNGMKSLMLKQLIVNLVGLNQ